MPRTRLRCLERARAAVFAWVVAGLLLMGSWPSAVAQGPVLRCDLQVRPGAAAQVLLEMTLVNPGPHALRFLVWGTPFEGAWLQPFVEVSRDGAAVAYRGAMAKRADPRPGDYRSLAAGQSLRATIDLAQAFDLSVPGTYRLVPGVELHDVIADAAPRARSRDRFQPLALDCPVVAFSRPTN